MKAVITVTGKDRCGIISKVSAICAENDVNILDISQTVLQDYFAMIMLVDIDNMRHPFTSLVELLEKEGQKEGLIIKTMHEDIFNSMHRI